MKIFMIKQGSPALNIHPQQVYLIFPENGFYICEPNGREVKLWPSAGGFNFKKIYVLRFVNQEEATIFVGLMSPNSENRTALPHDFDPNSQSVKHITP